METKRKYLVISEEYKSLAFEYSEYCEGHLSNHSSCLIIIKILDQVGSITIQGLPGNPGTDFYVWERELALKDAKEMIKFCLPGMIQKTRYFIKSGHFTIEVDEFKGANEGLVMAEIESDQNIEYHNKPAWLGMEVTRDKKFNHENLISKPFKNWKK